MITDRVDLTKAHAIAVRGILENACADNLACAEFADHTGKDLATYDPGRSDALDPEFVDFVEKRAHVLVREDIERIDDLVDRDGFMTMPSAPRTRSWCARTLPCTWTGWSGGRTFSTTMSSIRASRH